MKYKSIDEVLKALAEGSKDPQALNLVSGLYAFGRIDVDLMIKDAVDQGKILVFYYASEQDQEADILSYKFEGHE